MVNMIDADEWMNECVNEYLATITTNNIYCLFIVLITDIIIVVVVVTNKNWNHTGVVYCIESRIHSHEYILNCAYAL